MLRSRSDAESVSLPSLTSRSIPLRIGMVVLEETAFDTVLIAFTRASCVHVNLIFVPLFIYLLAVVDVVGLLIS